VCGVCNVMRGLCVVCVCVMCVWGIVWYLYVCVLCGMYVCSEITCVRAKSCWTL